MKGIIQEREDNPLNDQKGHDKTYQRFRINEQWGSNFEKTEFKAGDEVEYTIVEKGNFINFVNMHTPEPKVIEKAAPQTIEVCEMCRINARLKKIEGRLMSLESSRGDYA